MNRVARSRSRLLLTELIIAILFLSLGSAVCVRIFIQAHLDSRHARDLTFASAQVSSAASVVRYTDGSLQTMVEYYPYAEDSGDGLLVFYDEDQEQCPEEDAAYIMRIRTETSGIQNDSVITMTGAGDETLYELNIRHPADSREERP